jgi:hypothetical protein
VRWWRGGVVGVALGAGAALLAPAAPAAAEDAGARREVWVQGDSVLQGAVDAVRGRLGDWHDPDVAGFVGLSMSDAPGIFRDVQGDLGSVVVVELGLNDWGYGRASLDRMIDEAVAAVGGRHVIWLTSARFRPEMDAVNGAIRAAADRHANVEVLDWGPISDARPDLTYSDGVHLRPAGQQVIAQLIDDALEAWWRGRCLVPEAELVGSVRRLYRAYFLREPDAGGRDYWSARWRSGELCLPDISEYFASSSEFVARYGALGIPDFVRRVYLNVLDREPDPDGYEHWAGRLTYGGLRRGEMMVAFAQSPEFRARTGIP